MKNTPAFPRTGYAHPNAVLEARERAGLMTDPEDGMTLRQYGAFKFGPAIVIAHPELRNAEGGVDLIVQMALRLTDAMIAEMEKQQ